VVTEAFTGRAGKSVTVRDTIRGCDLILGGECDGWPESAFYMSGTLEEVRAHKDSP
jgi:F-type H+-transporting ATPase subunit beta